MDRTLLRCSTRHPTVATPCRTPLRQTTPSGGVQAAGVSTQRQLIMKNSPPPSLQLTVVNTSGNDQLKGETKIT